MTRITQALLAEAVLELERMGAQARRKRRLKALLPEAVQMSRIA